MKNGPLKHDVAIPDLQGKTAIVTGANSGIGLGITKRLAQANATVIMAVRDLQKGEQAINEIIQDQPYARLKLTQLDLADLASVNAFAQRLRKQEKSIHYLFNNAGVMNPPTRFTTKDGFELQFGANYLGHFALTGLLLPLLQTGKAHVVSMSSLYNRRGQINFTDLQWEQSYSAIPAYAQSKIALLMFAFRLNEISRRNNWGIISNAAHPGATITNLQLTGPTMGTNGQTRLQKLARHLPFMWQNVEHGCLPALYAAFKPGVTGGEYFGPDGFYELRGYPAPAKTPLQAENPQVQQRLWQLSERLTNVSFQYQISI
jgi:NAD(P)-dependent dehydrogenase (short-subunit alcohol dehydrogenase family)